MLDATMIDRLSLLGACRDALDWARLPTTPADPAAAWLACPRGDWLLWLAGRCPALPRAALVFAACACVREALHLVPAGEDRPRAAIEAAEAWARGGDGAPSFGEVLAAARAAAYAARAAAYAADAGVAYAAYAAAAAAAADAYARKQANIQMCQIIRTHLRYEDVAL